MQGQGHRSKKCRDPKRKGAWRSRFGEFRVSFKQLELLVALQRGEGLSAAARRLNVTQSGASKAAARLEKQLRVQLLDPAEPDAHAILSADGEELAASAAVVLAQLQEFRRDVRRVRWAAKVRAKELDRWKLEKSVLATSGLREPDGDRAVTRVASVSETRANAGAVSER